MYHLTEIYERYWKGFMEESGSYIAPRVFKAVNQTMACRTAKLGVSVYQCPGCEERKVVYHSCKNRFCPRCGYTETEAWGERLLGKLGPIRHHHVTFTLPEKILPITYKYPRRVYDSLFKAATSVLKDWFMYKHKMVPGIVAVLHTAGFALKRHIHLHVLVTGGGIQNGRWKELERNYLTRLDFFRDRFRWEFEHNLLLALRLPRTGSPSGELSEGYCGGETTEAELKRLFIELNKNRWVVAVQKGIYQPEQIVRYIGRYIKRAPLSEYKIKSIDDGTVSFECKDYRQSVGGKPRPVVVVLPAHEFMQRLTNHVPLEGFHMVRYYGAYCKQTVRTVLPHRQSWREMQIEHRGDDPLLCPHCGSEMVYCGMEFPERTYAKTG